MKSIFNQYLETINSEFSLSSVESYLATKINISKCKRIEFNNGSGITFRKPAERFDHDDADLSLIQYNDEILLKFKIKIAASVENPYARSRIDHGVRTVKYKTIGIDIGVGDQQEAEKQINKYAKRLAGTKWIKGEH